MPGAVGLPAARRTAHHLDDIVARLPTQGGNAPRPDPGAETTGDVGATCLYAVCDPVSRHYRTDDGVGLVHRGTRLVEAVAEVPGKGAYIVRREGDAAVEERLEPRLLPEPRNRG